MGRRQGSLGETGGIALARDGHRGLLVRGDASGVGNLDVEIVGAADSCIFMDQSRHGHVDLHHCRRFAVCVGRW